MDELVNSNESIAPLSEEKVILTVVVDKEGRLRIEIKTNDERLLILVKHYVEQTVLGVIMQNAMKARAVELTKGKEAAAIMEKLKGRF